MDFKKQKYFDNIWALFCEFKILVQQKFCIRNTTFEQIFNFVQQKFGTTSI
jgi:hypothetical protein